MPRTTVRQAAAAPVWQLHVSGPPRARPRRPGGPRALGYGIQYYRFNAALRSAHDTSLYPYSMEVVVPLAGVGLDGYLTTAEIQRLADIEEVVTAAVGDRAVLVGALTDVGTHRFVFYTGSPDWAAGLRGDLQTATRTKILRVNCDPDPQWFEYGSLRRSPDDTPAPWFLRPGRLIVLVLLLLAAFLLCDAVQAAYHGVWALGEVAVIAGLPAVRWLARHRLRQAPALPGVVAFVPSAVVMPGPAAVALSAIAFPLLAWTAHVPAWAGLVISLLAGPAVAAGARLALGACRARWQRHKFGSESAEVTSPR